jgi:two-component system, NtrC family, nitrogen regulation sensor histidine kinase NtrY
VNGAVGAPRPEATLPPFHINPFAMFFRHFHIQLLFRYLIITVVVAGSVYLFINTQLYFTAGALAIIAILMVYGIVLYMKRLSLDVDNFIDAVKNRDHAVYFSPKKYGRPFFTLFESFNDIIQTHKKITIEKESVFQLLKSVLERTPFGVITIAKAALEGDGGKYPILFINAPANRLLQIPEYHYWHRLAAHVPDFIQEIQPIYNGGKRFAEKFFNDRKMLLSIETQVIVLYHQEYLIITFQNIKDEVEQKEMEAWNKLIEVMTHEILNSITPIHTLAGTMKDMMDHKGMSLDLEDIEDMRLAASTIKRRSDGLMGFVQDYRMVAELPTPQLELFSVQELFTVIKTLMKPLADRQGIKMEVAQAPEKVRLHMDSKLIEQVLINLITNAIYAVKEAADPTIILRFRREEDKSCIDVIDNGKGIPRQLLDKIFIPFFTTRSNGSGIGLSISRNIMKMHQGNLEVVSVEHEETRFTLTFQ